MTHNPDPVQAFDLPEECRIDHVAIYPDDNPDEPHFYAIPYILERSNPDGYDCYREPLHFTVTDDYRNAVEERADISIEDIKLTREIETTKLEL